MKAGTASFHVPKHLQHQCESASSLLQVLDKLRRRQKMRDYREQQMLERTGITEYNDGAVQIEEVEDDIQDSSQGTTSSLKKCQRM